MEQVLPNEVEEQTVEESVSLLKERNLLKGKKKEIKGKIYDLQFDGLDEAGFEEAESKVNQDYIDAKNLYISHKENIHNSLIETKAEIKKIKEEYNLKIQNIIKNEKNPSQDVIEAAINTYNEQIEIENSKFLAATNELIEKKKSISAAAKEEDAVLRQEFSKLKKTPMKRSEKAEQIDLLKAKIYNNSGSADLELLSIKNQLEKLKIDHKKTIYKLKNDLDLKRNHVATLVKNTKKERNSVIAPLKEKADEYRQDYGSVADPIFQTGVWGRNFGKRFAKNMVTSFTTTRGFTNWLIHNAVYIIIIALLVVTAIIKPNWVNLDSFTAIIKHTASLLPLALGVAGTIVLTGTDLSLGRIWGFTALLAGILLGFSSADGIVFDWTANLPWIWIIVVLLIVMAVGGLLGSVNGFFVAKFSMHPFIVTLATQLIVYGIILLMGNGLHISVIFKDSALAPISESYYNFISSGFKIGDTLVEWYNIYAILILAIMWFVWNKTKFGKSMFAVGCNPEAANVSGINVQRTIITTFVIAGVLYGVGGFEYNPIYGGAQLSTGYGGELDPITAAVIGGVSFTGGIGKVSGVLLGCLLLKIIDSCLLALSAPTALINLAKGVIILIAVALDMKKYISKK